MKKSEVYFLKDFSRLKEATQKILADFYPTKAKVLVKIHFGEPGNPTALTPKKIEPIVEALKELGLELTFIDTPVAYPSPRSTVTGYQKVVKEKGYERLADFIISDRFKKVKVKDFEAWVCQELLEAENVLVISHVKGHSCAGFGGAIKNFGMGGLMIESKKAIHDLCKPKFVAECQGCGTCVRLCPAKAIELFEGKAKFDLEKCWGCSICQLVCPYKVLVPKKALFDDLLAQGASAVINHLKKAYYINILKDITQKCDCDRKGSETISKDVGVLFSDNPVAIDQASLDLIKKTNKKDAFFLLNHKDPYLQINYAQKYTTWPSEYYLKKI